jgi:hypothetical protein
MSEPSFVAIDLCFYCREPNNNLIVHKRMRDVLPREVISSMEPCDACKARMKEGVMLVVVKDGEYGKERPEIAGAYAVVKDEAIERMLAGNPSLREYALKKRMLFIEETVARKAGISMEAPEQSTPLQAP